MKADKNKSRAKKLPMAWAYAAVLKKTNSLAWVDADACRSMKEFRALHSGREGLRFVKVLIQEWK